jgi:hypothetical protein
MSQVTYDTVTSIVHFPESDKIVIHATGAAGSKTIEVTVDVSNVRSR